MKDPDHSLERPQPDEKLASNKMTWMFCMYYVDWHTEPVVAVVCRILPRNEIKVFKNFWKLDSIWVLGSSSSSSWNIHSKKNIHSPNKEPIRIGMHVEGPTTRKTMIWSLRDHIASDNQTRSSRILEKNCTHFKKVWSYYNSDWAASGMT